MPLRKLTIDGIKFHIDSDGVYFNGQGVCRLNLADPAVIEAIEKARKIFERQQTGERIGYVYVYRSALYPGYCKIGSTVNPSVRMGEAGGYTEIIRVMMLPTRKAAYRLENDLQAVFNQKEMRYLQGARRGGWNMRTSGKTWTEFFALNEDDIMYVRGVQFDDDGNIPEDDDDE